MKSFNIRYTDFNALEDFISLNSISESGDILVQIFCGVIDENYALKVSSELKNLLPHANIIGTTTGGEILGGEILENTVIISISVFQTTLVKSKLYKLDDKFDIKSISDDLILENTKALIMFSDGLKSNAEKLLKEIRALKPEMVIVGGRAGDNSKFKKTFVFDEKKFYENGCVLATLNSAELIANSDYILNWTPIGKDMKVTKVDNNILYELDGVPILEVYEKYLGIDVVKNLPHSSMEFPLIIKKDNLYMARDPIIKTEDDALVFAGSFEQGDTVQFSFGNIDDVVEDNKKYFNLFSKLPSESIFIYSCTARKILMGDRLVDELNILESISPTVGFFTYGEYFNGSSLAELLNVTTTFLVLSESSVVKDKKLKEIQTRDYDIVRKALTNLIKVTNEELKHISTHDVLTSIHNRAEYIKRISSKIKSTQRYQENFGVILIDIDHFKLINDNYGHKVGDDVLRDFANILVKNIREDDFVARWGGEEFIIIANYATFNTLEKLTKKIQKKISEHSFTPVPRLTASFGLSVYMDGDSEETIFKRVDNALYVAKQNGRDRYIFC